ncbi:hypothetical protein UlMin_044823 [Ulmus minor]
MERNSAACAMQWSIELEKGLRSKKPGRSAEAILQFGQRLQQWSREPEPSSAAHHLFDLIPGEDRLFANAILLRLADTFRLGDDHIRRCVVKVFLSEYRCREKRKGCKGLLSKERVENQSELLTRVKFVFDNGDGNSRALALVIFGCWADFAKDSAHVRYLVLSSFVSSHALEAKAALFAAGCFCEVSDDFPCIVLELLVNLMTSSETSLPIKLAGARVFSKMGYSYSIANRAYKTGLKLLLDSLEEDYQIALLVSLSKLASTSTMLTSDQVEFLFSFLSQENTIRVRTTTLRCLCFIFSKGLCHFSVGPNLVQALFSTLDEPALPSNIQCEALWILRKMLLYMLPSLPSNILDLSKLLSIAENASPSLFMSKSLLATRVLVDMSIKFKEHGDLGSGLFCSSPTLSQLISLIINRITLLMKPLFDLGQADVVALKEVNNLLYLLLLMVGEHPELIALVLDQISTFIRNISNMHDIITTTQADILRHEKGMAMRLKVACKLHRFLLTFLENLSEAGTINMVVYDKVKLLVKQICEGNLFDCYTQTIYSLLLHSRVIWHHKLDESEDSCIFNRNSGMLLDNCSVGQELVSFKFAKKVLAENMNWSAYRVGSFSVCQGAWFVATFIFQQLITQVHSESCSCWLKSLFQFACSEAKLTLSLLTKRSSSLVDWLETMEFPLTLLRNDLGEMDLDGADNLNEPNYGKVLLGAYNSICSSKETLETAFTVGQSFCFQKWFLFLRAKVLRAVVDVLDTLETIPFVSESSSINEEVGKSFMVQCLQRIVQISLRLKRIAEEFDLVGASFIDIDNKSAKIISGLALSCSLVAFITGFTIFVPNLPTASIARCPESSENILRAYLVQNLAGRLWQTDRETSEKLCQLIDLREQPDNRFCLLSGNQVFNISSEAREVIVLCSHAVSRIACLKIEAAREQSEENITGIIKDGLKLTFEILMKWMEIPFRTPKYFFRLRPSIGSELFAENVSEATNGLHISPGQHLSLSLCLQLKNLPLQSTKLYCMLRCGVSSIERKEEQCRSGFQAWETDEMVEMNKELFRYVTESESTSDNIMNINKRRCGIDDDREFVNSFVCCKLNERGIGFSGCSLDVSGFPTGSYRIKWHSCCVDNQSNYWSLLPLNAGPVFTIQ